MRWQHVALVGTVLLASAVALGFFWPFRDSDRALRMPGVVEVQEVRLGSKVGGRVKEVKVAEGELVEPGQPVVVFEVPEAEAQLEQARASLRAAEAEAQKARVGPRPEEKDAARAALDVAKARYERMRIGWRQEEKDAARSEFEAAEADARVAREEWERADRLYTRRTIPESEHDAARGNLERATGRSKAAKARLNLILAGSRTEDIAEMEAAQRQADANLRLLLAGTREEDVAAAEARAAEARDRVRELEIAVKEAVVVAPERAVVQVLPVRKGDIIGPNQPVVRVLRAEDLWVRVYVPETELGKVKVGQLAEVTVDAYPGKRFTGRVVQVSAESEFTPRNVQSPDERRHQVFGLKVRMRPGPPL